MNRSTDKIINYLALFGSTGTLICCALPSLLVALGLGASLSGLISVFPQITWISQYKVIIFSISGLLILGSFYFQYKAQNAPCPIDEHKKQACQSSRRLSLIISFVSSIIWLIGAFFAFIIVRM